MTEAMVTVRGKDSYKCEGQYKGSTGWFNPDHELKKRKVSTIEPDFYKNFYEKDIKGQYMELYETFFVPLVSTKLNLNNINNPVKNIASSSDKIKKGESCGTNYW